MSHMQNSRLVQSLSVPHKTAVADYAADAPLAFSVATSGVFTLLV